MKPAEKKPETVFRIVNNKTNEFVGSYSRAFCDEYDFRSIEDARNANCHGEFRNKDEYRIAKYKVTYTLIDDDCDKKTKKERDEELNKEQDFIKKFGAKGEDLLRVIAEEVVKNGWNSAGGTCMLLGVDPQIIDVYISKHKMLLTN